MYGAMADTPEPPRSWASRLFSHPAVLLALAAVLTGLLVPWVTSRWEERDRKVEASRAATERELAKLGRRPYRRTRRLKADGVGIASLTGRELEVARLVVDRRTNAQIAATLFLSPKTVETHIRNVFHKLDVSSRVEVARAVERADHSARSSTPL